MSSKRSLRMHPSTNPSGLPNPRTTHSTGRDQPRPHSNVSNSGPTVHQSRPPPMVPQAPQGLPSPPLLDAEASHQMNRKKLPSSLCKNWSKSPTSYTKTTKPTNHLCQSPSCPNQTSIHPKRSLRQKTTPPRRTYQHCQHLPRHKEKETHPLPEMCQRTKTMLLVSPQHHKTTTTRWTLPRTNPYR